MVCADKGVEEVHSSSAFITLKVLGYLGEYPSVDESISEQCFMVGLM